MIAASVGLAHDGTGFFDLSSLARGQLGQFLAHLGRDVEATDVDHCVDLVPVLSWAITTALHRVPGPPPPVRSRPLVSFRLGVGVLAHERETDPHIHVEQKVLEAGPAVRNLINAFNQVILTYLSDPARYRNTANLNVLLQKLDRVRTAASDTRTTAFRCGQP
ncbi:hypothetical protein [Kibdelosporangium phytohabitans]|uniref:Uncharacterized protein n=1 Tax=Kibdelosporangium phytohabitans TaxID=860235 RepID=A0A0N9HXJ2_9PSEU|nr:hypothetical protein [Kibdelosporangium phytohabitans]ALG06956.1 hypothetical protein AOZ06_08485 [Kibdelosporangium phytohabitans]MBE1468234.1 hypothetical protein [Kibdelosporangium phytohabitans]